MRINHRLQHTRFADLGFGTDFPAQYLPKFDFPKCRTQVGGTRQIASKRSNW